VGGFQSRSFDCELGSQSHRGYVSRSPPIIPDGQISRVRFETSAVFRGPSQKRERFKNAGSYTPLPSLVYPRPRLPAGMWRCAGFIKPAAHTGEETAKCPEPLCPTSALPPLGRRVLISSESVTPRSSLLRAHVPLPLGSLLLQHLASFGESLQVVPAPAAHGSFPTLSLRIFPWMLDPVPRRSHCVHLPVSSAVSSAFSQQRWDRLPALLRKTTSRGPSFEVADIP
jgi:hypothetical protein